jgi:hypothetical protein
MSELTTVPMFVFYQGNLGDGDWEKPIEVKYYNGCIQLEQQGEYAQPEKISVHPEFVVALLKEIKKHLPDANYFINKK